MPLRAEAAGPHSIICDGISLRDLTGVRGCGDIVREVIAGTVRAQETKDSGDKLQWTIRDSVRAFCEAERVSEEFGIICCA